MRAGAVGGVLTGSGGIAVSVFAVRDALEYLAVSGDSHLQQLVGAGAVAVAALIGLFATAVVGLSVSALVRRTPRPH